MSGIDTSVSEWFPPDLSGSDYKSSDDCSHYHFLVAIAVVATFFSHAKIAIVAILNTVAQEKVATFLGYRLSLLFRYFPIKKP